MKVFIVNLARRPDRLAAVKSGLPSEWLAGAEFTTHWPGPVDGSTIRGEADLQAAGIALYDSWQQPESNNAFWNRPLKLGEIGCAYAHISVWRRAQQAFENDPTLKWVMVIEDDAVVPEDRRSQAPEIVNQLIARLDTDEWDLLYLGRVLQRGKSDLVPPSKPSPSGEFSLGK